MFQSCVFPSEGLDTRPTVCHFDTGRLIGHDFHWAVDLQSTGEPEGMEKGPEKLVVRGYKADPGSLLGTSAERGEGR